MSYSDVFKEYSISFYDGTKLMKRIKVEAPTLRTAMSHALWQVEGFMSFNRIKIQKL